MATENVVLKLMQLILPDPDVGQLAKARVDPIDRAARSHHLLQEIVGTDDVGYGRIGQGDAGRGEEGLQIGPSLGTGVKAVVHGHRKFTRGGGYLAHPNPNTGPCDSH